MKSIRSAKIFFIENAIVLLFSILFVCGALSSARATPSNHREIEDQLVEIYKTELEYADLTLALQLPKTISPEQLLAGGHLIVALAEDTAMVISWGASEAVVKTVKVPTTCVGKADKATVAVEHALKATVFNEGDTTLPGEMILTAVDLTAGEVPIVRSVWAAGQVYMAGKNADKKARGRLAHFAKSIAEDLQTKGMADEITGIRQKISRLKNPEKQREYKTALEGLVKRRAYIQAYVELLKRSVDPVVRQAYTQTHFLGGHPGETTIAGDEYRFNRISDAYLDAAIDSQEFKNQLFNYVDSIKLNALQRISEKGVNTLAEQIIRDLDKVRGLIGSAKKKAGAGKTPEEIYEYIRFATGAWMSHEHLRPEQVNTPPIPGTTTVPEYARPKLAQQLPYAERIHLPGEEQGASDQIPVILVHGDNGEKHIQKQARWQTLVNNVVRYPDMANRFDFFIWYHDTSKPVGFNGQTGNAEELAAFITNMIEPFYTEKIILIAHSRGGLVCRSYMNYSHQGDQIEKLITLGTPHHGSPLAVPDWTALTWSRINQTYSKMKLTLEAMTKLYLSRLYHQQRFRTTEFKNLYNSLCGPHAKYFDTTNIGSLNLAWDNMDQAISNHLIHYDVNIAADGFIHLTTCDANEICAAPANDQTRFDRMKGINGSLAELNRTEQYQHKIIPFAAYQDHEISPLRHMLNFYINRLKAGQIHDTGLDDYLLELGKQPKEHLGLKVLNLLLMASSLKGREVYLANDGMVPVQSALFLDLSKYETFSRQTDKRVDIDETHIKESLLPGIPRFYLFNDINDNVGDHLDLLDTTNGNYWTLLLNEVRGTIRQQDRRLVLIIDKSGSMGGEKIRQAKDATKIICNLFSNITSTRNHGTIIGRMGNDNHIGIVGFNSNARILADFSGGFDQAALNRKINALKSGGGTSITSGLQAAEKMMAETGRYTLVLLSDGQDRSVLNSPALAHITGQGIPIHTIGLGRDADTKTLKKIARLTSGFYYHADTMNLTQIFSNIWSQITHNQTLLSHTGLIKQNELIKIPLKIIKDATNVVVHLNWPGSRLGLGLVNSRGQNLIGPDNIIEKTGTYLIANLPIIPADTYDLQVLGQEISRVVEPFNLSVISGGNSGINLLPLKSEYRLGHGVDINFRVNSKAHQEMRVEVEKPSGERVRVTTGTEKSVGMDKLIHARFDATDELGFYKLKFINHSELICSGSFRVGAVQEVHQLTMGPESQLDMIALKAQKAFSDQRRIRDFNVYCTAKLIRSLAPALKRVELIINGFKTLKGSRGVNLFLQTLTPFLEDTDIDSIGYIQNQVMTANTDPEKIQKTFTDLEQQGGIQEILKRHGMFVLPINRAKKTYLSFSIRPDGNNFSNTVGRSMISGAHIDWNGVDELLFKNILAIIPNVIAGIEGMRMLHNMRFAITVPFIESMMSSLLPWCGIELINTDGQIYFQKNKLAEKEPEVLKNMHIPARQVTPIRLFSEPGGEVVIYGELE